MKKKELFQSLKVIALALILAVGVSYATGAWEDASGTPPENNAPRPVNVSDEVQTKAGDLYIENSGVGLFGTELLAVFGESSFNDKVSLGDDTDLTDEDVDLYVSGAIKNENLVVGGITYPAQVCAQLDGTLTLCETPPGPVWDYFTSCNESTPSCPPSPTDDFRPAPWGTNGGFNDAFDGTDPDTTPGIFWVQEVYADGVWHNMLAEGYDFGSADQSCVEHFEDVVPGWTFAPTYYRLIATYDDDWDAATDGDVLTLVGHCLYQHKTD